MNKPYIQLDQDFPGIVSLFMYDREVASRLTAMGQTIMRRPRGLSIGDRELIGAFVSKLNECDFCYDSHAACARQYLGNQLVDEFLIDENSGAIPLRLRSLMCVALCVQSLDRDELPNQITHAKALGCTDEEIHDTVLVTAFFSMCNRYVDGLGTTCRIGEAESGGEGLAKWGYTMGFGRFFREVLPKLWHKWFSSPR
jgi:uncharacterized peroxidase-related enzyme